MNYQRNYQHDNLLRELMAADFTLIELGLYLDTHPTDQEAIALFNSNLQKAKMLRETYERMYGPLTIHTPSNRNVWKWINSPWPWQIY
ncbi:MAG TPA: spore coat protein CotJB [Clostridiaceae bacterium]|nr:spore coat protein CotJB [Clostridiaceae bacterium]